MLSVDMWASKNAKSDYLTKQLENFLPDNNKHLIRFKILKLVKLLSWYGKMEIMNAIVGATHQELGWSSCLIIINNIMQ